MKKLFFKRLFRRLRHVPVFLKESYNWEYETCQTCGNSFRILWSIKDKIWNKVTETNDGSGGSYCVDCFIKEAERQKIKITKDDFNFIEPFNP